jgi:hypothetical protein
MYRKKTNDYDFLQFLGNLTALQEEKNRQQSAILENQKALLGIRAWQRYKDAMREGASVCTGKTTVKDVDPSDVSPLPCPEGAD